MKDLLVIIAKLSGLKEDGIHVQPNETKHTSGERLVFEWDDDMRALIEEIKQIKLRRIGDAPLFATRQGKPYIDAQGRCNAFDSLWQRFMES